MEVEKTLNLMVKLGERIKSEKMYGNAIYALAKIQELRLLVAIMQGLDANALIISNTVYGDSVSSISKRFKLNKDKVIHDARMYRKKS